MIIPFVIFAFSMTPAHATTLCTFHQSCTFSECRDITENPIEFEVDLLATDGWISATPFAGKKFSEFKEDVFVELEVRNDGELIALSVRQEGYAVLTRHSPSLDGTFVVSSAYGICAEVDE